MAMKCSTKWISDRLMKRGRASRNRSRRRVRGSRLEGSDPMVAASGLTIVDTNVFVIDLRCRRDRNFKANRRLLDRIARDGDGATTLFNVLEVAGSCRST